MCGEGDGTDGGSSVIGDESGDQVLDYVVVQVMTNMMVCLIQLIVPVIVHLLWLIGHTIQLLKVVDLVMDQVMVQVLD